MRVIHLGEWLCSRVKFIGRMRRRFPGGIRSDLWLWPQNRSEAVLAVRASSLMLNVKS